MMTKLPVLTHNSQPILILGAGVNGLSCGIHLLHSGYKHVHILTHKTHPKITSSKAGAVWFPYLVEPKDRISKWAINTYHHLLSLDGRPDETGVRFIEFNEISRTHLPDPLWSDGVRNYRRLAQHELPSATYTSGYACLVPMMDTSIYMPYLMNEFIRAGGTMTIAPTPLLSLSDSTIANYRIIINCTGLGAGRLVNDPDVYPMKGMVLRTTNPANAIARSTTDEHNPDGVAYIIPRMHDCIIGGISVKDSWDESPDDAAASGIAQRCSSIEPAISTAQVLEVRTGLRPGRSQVRLEAVTMPYTDVSTAADNNSTTDSTERTTVIHNYGHGGAGFTLSWGCAFEVAALVATAMKSEPLSTLH